MPKKRGVGSSAESRPPLFFSCPFFFYGGCGRPFFLGFRSGEGTHHTSTRHKNTTGGVNPRAARAQATSRQPAARDVDLAQAGRHSNKVWPRRVRATDSTGAATRGRQTRPQHGCSTKRGPCRVRATTANPQAATHSIRRPQITGPQAARAQHQNPRRVPATTTRCSGRKGRGYRSADQRAATPTMHNPQGCNRRTPQAARAQRQEPIRPQGTAAESRRPQAKREQPPGRQNRLQEHNPPGHRPQGTIKPPGHKAHTANSQQHPPQQPPPPGGPGTEPVPLHLRYSHHTTQRPRTPRGCGSTPDGIHHTHPSASRQHTPPSTSKATPAKPAGPTTTLHMLEAAEHTPTSHGAYYGGAVIGR